MASVLITSTIVLIMSTGVEDLGTALFGKTRSRLLATILGESERFFFVRQLARLVATSAGTAQRELRMLTSVGLIQRIDRDGQVLYCANRKHPIFGDLRSLLAKTNGASYLLRNALVAISSGIEFAFIYGSFAKSEEGPESDVDVFVCGDARLDTVLELLAPVAHKLGRPVNPTLYSSDELRTKLHNGNHFLRALQGATLTFLIGNEDEFRAIR